MSSAELQLFSLKNKRGMRVAIASYGATVVSLHVPDRHGQFADVVLGFDDLERYGGDHPYFGATIGRFGNRIARGRFQLDGHEYVLATNDGAHHLHGGPRGFDKVLWSVEQTSAMNDSTLSLRHLSVDGDEGYPGTLDATVRYTLTEDNELRIDYSATSDRPTIVIKKLIVKVIT